MIDLYQDERPWWVTISPDDPDTILLGGGLEGMTHTMKHHRDCVTYPLLLQYDCIEDFIEDYIEATLSHEHIHIALCHLEGSVVAGLWDNVDGLFQITLNGEPF